MAEANRLSIQKQLGTELGIPPRISGGWNVASSDLNQPGESAPYRLFKENYDEWGFGVEDDGQGFFTPIPRIPFDERVQNPETNDMMIAHHTGGKHFTEPSIDELIQGLIDGQVPAGTLGDPETEQRMIEEYQRTKQDRLISWVKNVGDELTLQEIGDGLRIIDSTETNPLKKRLRLDRMMKNNPPRV